MTNHRISTNTKACRDSPTEEAQEDSLPARPCTWARDFEKKRRSRLLIWILWGKDYDY